MSTVIAENFETPDGTAVVPVGTVIMYYGATAPTGYLECNGQSTTGYDELLELIGANTPDLRGEFIRGWDNGRGIDTGRTLGSTQTDEIESHTHTCPAGVTGGGNLPVQGGGAITTTTGYASGSAGGSETRPRNVALMYCIKH